jgi:hypothetical protein
MCGVAGGTRIAWQGDVSLTDHLKGRIAEALVESIFRQHGYKVSRLGREKQIQSLVNLNRDEFLPDFLVWKVARGASFDLHRMLNVEATYRADLDDFLQRDGVAMLSQAQQRWPSLYFVFVTDTPEAHRSCFQTVWLHDYVRGSVPTTIDLHEMRDLGICRSTVTKHEVMVQHLFATLKERIPARRAAPSAPALHRLRA